MMSMFVDLSKTGFGILIAVSFLFIGSQVARGQPRCMTGYEMKAMITRINSEQKVSLNNPLRKQLLDLRDKNQKLFRYAAEENSRDAARLSTVDEARHNIAARLCQILKASGWPTTSLVGKDGAASAFFLLKNSESLQLQVQLLPVIAAALKKNEVSKADFAELIDHVRARGGLKQLFGTQVSIANGFLVLYPIAAEAQVDARRSKYGLPPLAEYIRSLEGTYQIPLIKSPVVPTSSSGELRDSVAKSIVTNLPEAQTAEEDVVRVDTSLVNLNVSVYNDKTKASVGTLEKNDFAVWEDGHQEDIGFFAAADVPCDVVLLSGTTFGRRDLIRKATERFIRAARPSDRLAIVSSLDKNVISPLTEDHVKLLESIKKMDSGNGSYIWAALRFTIDQVFDQKSVHRRRVVVLMSDGVDRGLEILGFSASNPTDFADLLETVRRSDTLILSINLNTESDAPFIETPITSRTPRPFHSFYENGRKTMALLAEVSGGIYYEAKKIEDLDGVYDQAIIDLGRIYSLGYKPKSQKRDGAWRAVRVQIPTHPDLTVRARPGYYAN